MREVLLSIHIEALPEGSFLATSDDLPGLVAQGRTAAATLEIPRDVARALVESCQQHGDPLPAAFRELASGDGEIRCVVVAERDKRLSRAHFEWITKAMGIKVDLEDQGAVEAALNAE